jgi:acetyl esterase/lipase
MLDDAHRIITWAREHAVELGADPARIVIAGSSAGAHLALTAALTAGTEAKVAAAIGLYGYYGVVDSGGLSSQPAAHVHPDAPPVMIVHGEQDTLLPAGLQMRLVDALRRTSCSPVVYAELPGAQHTFDLLHSLRFELVVDALWAFCSWATNREDGGSPLRARSEALGPASAHNREVRSLDGPHPPIHYTDLDGSGTR